MAAPGASLVHGLSDAALLLVISETALFRHFVPALDEHFVMAYWDQPGAGRSYSAAALRRGLDLERVLAGLDRVVDRLRARFARDRAFVPRFTDRSPPPRIARPHGAASTEVGTNGSRRRSTMARPPH